MHLIMQRSTGKTRAFPTFGGIVAMKLLEDRILQDARVLPGGVLMVGSFLNQQIDPALLREMGREVASLFADCGVNKILTVEASGIALACAAAMELGVPMVFAKKHKTSNVDGSVYSTPVHSFTHGNDYDMVVSREYLRAEDRVLLVDDFLASGNALFGLIRLVEQAGATLCGASCAIEKRFQGGGDQLREMGVRVESLAIVERMTDTELFFGEA